MDAETSRIILENAQLKVQIEDTKRLLEARKTANKQQKEMIAGLLQDNASLRFCKTPLTEYDAGILNDWGGGNVEWWQDYIRSELSRAYEFYQSQIGY